MRALLACLAGAGLLAGCGVRTRLRDKPRPEPVAAASHDAEAPPAIVRTGPEGAVIIDAADPSTPCIFGYHGTVLDLGAFRSGGEFGPKLRPAPVTVAEHEGSSWASVHGKVLSVDFFVVLPADVTAEGPAGATPYVEARVRGGAARSASFFLNGRPIGAALLPRGQPKTVVVKGPGAQPIAGPNELTIRFSGMPKAGPDVAAEIEWVHFGVGEPDPLYAAPTRRDTQVSRTFSGKPGRALSLRGPGFARCEGWLPAGGSVESRLMLEGGGAADAEVRVVRDRVPPTVIGTLHLEGDAGDGARVHSWPLGDVGAQGTLVAVELSVVRASRGARVIFGEPRVRAEPVAAEAKKASTPTSKGVVVVVLSEVGARSLAAYGGPLATPQVSALAATGLVFDASRATTGVASGAVGSILTGLGARDLGLVDGDSRLPHDVTTLADAVRQAGIASAFFTANPLTSPAFGFDRGWTHYESHGPTEEGPAARVFDSAVAWLDEHRTGPFLVVIHARGGHPPWDVPLERVKTLPPENYTGGLEARHAGELLGRSLRAPGSYRFDDADRARGWALYGAAMESEDAGIGRVVAQLRASGLYETTTLIVTSDVGVNEAARVPFAESESIDEAALATPLIMRGPRDSGVTRVSVGVSGDDIATTVLAAFGLPAPITFHGRDLRALAAESAPSVPRPALAVAQDRFALLWGTFVTSGARDHESKLCDLSLEPACVTDVRPSYPLAGRLLHAALFDDLVTRKPLFVREAASLDMATLAALKAWGR